MNMSIVLDTLGISPLGLIGLVGLVLTIFLIVVAPKQVINTYHNLRFLITFKTWPWLEPRSRKVVQHSCVDRKMAILAKYLKHAYEKETQSLNLIADNQYTPTGSRILVFWTGLHVRFNKRRYFSARNVAITSDFNVKGKHEDYLLYS